MADETNTPPPPANPDTAGAGAANAPASAGTAGNQGSAATTPPAGQSGNNDGDNETESIEDAGNKVKDSNVTPEETKPVERDPDAREVIRSDLARGLLWLLTITIGAVIFFVGLGQVPSDVLTQSIFPSLVTLTGTALGFYFGAQTAKKD